MELTALTNEMGRRVPNIVGFVTPDDEGGIVISEGLGSDGAVVTTRYRMVTGPTPYLYMQVAYDLTDAPNGIIRQMGILWAPRSKRACRPANVFSLRTKSTSPACCWPWKFCNPPPRNPQVRQAVEFVLPV